MQLDSHQVLPVTCRSVLACASSRGNGPAVSGNNEGGLGRLIAVMIISVDVAIAIAISTAGSMRPLISDSKIGRFVSPCDFEKFSTLLDARAVGPAGGGPLPILHGNFTRHERVMFFGRCQPT